MSLKRSWTRAVELIVKALATFTEAGDEVFGRKASQLQATHDLKIKPGTKRFYAEISAHGHDGY
jgi:hypothetical protein